MSETKAEYLLGLDLGQQNDYSAAAVLEKTFVPDPERPDRTVSNYSVRFLRRWPLGSAYPTVVDDVRALFEKPPLSGGTLIIDNTGIGRPIGDMFQRAQLNVRKLVRLTITGGRSVSASANEYHCAKTHLAGVLQTLLGHRRLQIAPTLPDAPVLVKELRTFSTKITPTGDMTYEAWRSAEHDDMCLAVAVAAFVGELPAKNWHFEVYRPKTASAAAARAALSRPVPFGWHGW